MARGGPGLCTVVVHILAPEYRNPSAAPTGNRKMSDLLSALTQAGIRFMPMNEAAALKSAQCRRAYPRKGGKKGRIAADFLVGGHALVQCDRLLTRDNMKVRLKE
jgi:predicted nucleic acid-binding protein